jgi:hypothetical protein
MAEQDVASTAARRPRIREARCRGRQTCQVAWSLRAGAGGNAGDGSGSWADNATVERREAASWLRGRRTPRKRGSRLTSATFRRLAPPGAPPTPRSGCCEEEAKNPAQDAGDEETALFDIVKVERREAYRQSLGHRAGGNALGSGRGRACARRPRYALTDYPNSGPTTANVRTGSSKRAGEP